MVSKICAIHLMEGDFCALNMIIFGDGMLHNMRQNALMSEETYIEKGENQQFMEQLSRSCFMTSPINSANQSQYHQWIHPIALIEYTMPWTL